VLVALALGASAELVGRPELWGLEVGGAAGVRHVLDLLHADLDRTLTLAGVTGPADLRDDLVATVACG
ncbi:alpha-hydroxy-acid oxidizing protein, partial [Micromonospora sp. D75]|uniref:alpha-hydroxy-acid oxidizing protein n=1 Tax=Micromonospora sp. D75 TaxID=2824885 RepID=UPI001B36AC80